MYSRLRLLICPSQGHTLIHLQSSVGAGDYQSDRMIFLAPPAGLFRLESQGPFSTRRPIPCIRSSAFEPKPRPRSIHLRGSVHRALIRAEDRLTVPAPSFGLGLAFGTFGLGVGAGAMSWPGTPGSGCSGSRTSPTSWPSSGRMRTAPYERRVTPREDVYPVSDTEAATRPGVS